MANSDPAILRKAVSSLYNAFRESVDNIGNISSIDVSIRQHQTMALVCRLTEEKPNGVTLKELAESMKLAPATVSELVESLVRKNFLQRIQKPDDRRAVQARIFQYVDAVGERRGVVLALRGYDRAEHHRKQTRHRAEVYGERAVVPFRTDERGRCRKA